LTTAEVVGVTATEEFELGSSPAFAAAALTIGEDIEVAAPAAGTGLACGASAEVVDEPVRAAAPEVPTKPTAATMPVANDAVTKTATTENIATVNDRLIDPPSNSPEPSVPPTDARYHRTISTAEMCCAFSPNPAICDQRKPRLAINENRVELIPVPRGERLAAPPS
jgi:hypothetical protein